MGASMKASMKASMTQTELLNLRLCETMGLEASKGPEVVVGLGTWQVGQHRISSRVEV
jgi:hypothetical protein